MPLIPFGCQVKEKERQKKRSLTLTEVNVTAIDDASVVKVSCLISIANYL